MKTTHKKIRFWSLYHLGLLIFSAIAALLMKYRQTGEVFHPTVIVAFTTIFLMSAGIGYLAIFMVNKAHNYSQAQMAKRIIPGLVIFYLGSFIIANLSISFGVFFWFLHLGRDLSEFMPHLFQHELSFASGNFLIWLMFFTIAFFYVLWHKSVKKEMKLKEENQKYKYQNLKSQVNPHFLFNSLNTLSELIYEDTAKSDAYIQKLSGIYRYILENEETELISVEKELDFVRQYFELQQQRDNDKIQLQIDFEHPENYKTIPMSLQILVENALKHNARSEETPLHIKIHQSNGYVVVSNAIQRKNSLERTFETGLSNLRERVKLILGQALIVSEESNQFIVKLPIIEDQK